MIAFGERCNIISEDDRERIVDWKLETWKLNTKVLTKVRKSHQMIERIAPLKFFPKTFNSLIEKTLSFEDVTLWSLKGKR